MVSGGYACRLMCRNCGTQLNAENVKPSSGVCKECNVTMSKRWQVENRGRHVRRAVNEKAELKAEAIAAYGGRCAFCGESDPHFLAIDHINNDGKADRLLSSAGISFYRRLRVEGWPQGRLQVLCHNCNMVKVGRKPIPTKNDITSAATKKERHALYMRSWYHKLRREAFDAYGGECECCGDRRFEVYTVDHTHGAGRKSRKTEGVGATFLSKIKQAGWPKDKYRILCANCNYSLGFYGYCPHGEVASYKRKVKVIVRKLNT